VGETWEKGQIIERETDPSTHMRIVEKGQCKMEVHDPDKLPAFMKSQGATSFVLGPGGFFGVRGLLCGAPVGFTVVAVEKGTKTLSISLAEILDTAEHGERDALFRSMRDGMRCYLLRQIPQLKTASEAALQTLLGHVKELKYRQGDVIHTQGEVLNEVLLLEAGILVESEHLTNQVSQSSARNLSREKSTPGECYGISLAAPSTKNSKILPFTLLAHSDVTMLSVPTEGI